MSVPAMTQMSSEGQIVIPEGVRKELGLRPGARFVVLSDNGVVILKAITEPSMEDFDMLIAQTRRQARQAGMKRSDIPKAIAKVRASG